MCLNVKRKTILIVNWIVGNGIIFDIKTVYLC